MSDHRWRVGITGCGKIAGGWDHPQESGDVATHAQAYYRHPEFQLVAVSDRDPEALGRFQRSWGVDRGYQSVGEMQEAEGVDVVSICSPNALHCSDVEQLLDSTVRPRAILLEKPACVDAQGLARLTKTVSHSEVEVVVNHTRRFDAAHQRVARLIQSGSLGRLVDGKCTYYGGWIHNGSHVVDTLRMVFGEEPAVLSATTSGSGRPGDGNVDVRLQVAGSTVSVEGFDERHYQLFEPDFRFELGRVRLIDFGRTISVERVNVNGLGERVLEPEDWSPLEGMVSPLYRAIEGIAAHLQGRGLLGNLRVGLSEAALTMKIIWEAIQMASASSKVAAGT